MKRKYIKLLSCLLVAATMLVLNSCTEPSNVDSDFIWPTEIPNDANVESISLNYESYPLEVGGEVALEAVVAPSNAAVTSVTWSSSDSSVATVDGEGNVVAVAVGEAIISATTDEEGSDVAGECSIEVTDKYVKVIELSIDDSNSGIPDDGMVIGDSYTFEVIFNSGDEDQPTNQYVSWTSSDTSIATVSGGVVTALSAGEATITAASVESSSITVSYEIFVKNMYVEQITSITQAGDLRQGGTTQLSPVLYPLGASNRECTWSITAGGDYAVIDAATGEITASQIGGAENLTVTVKVVSNENAEAAYSADISILPALIESISISSSASTIGISGAGSTCEITASYTPWYAGVADAAWSTNSAAVATVSGDEISATVSGVGAGDADITLKATSANGEEFSKTISIEVIAAEPITIDPSYNNAVYAFNENTVQIPLTVGTASSWSTSDSSVATVSSSGLVSFTGYGSVTITVTNSAGTSDSIALEIPAGFVRQTYFNSDSSTWDWGLSTYGSCTWNSDGYLDITSYEGTEGSYLGRADFACINTTKTGEGGDSGLNYDYPLMAVRMTDILQYEYISKRVLHPAGIGLSAASDASTATDVSKTLTTSIPTHYYYKLSDGSQILVWNLSLSGTLGATSFAGVESPDVLYVANFAWTYSTFTPTSTDESYIAQYHPYKWKLYSFQTFQTTDDIDSYIEDDLGLEVESLILNLGSSVTSGY